MGHNAFLSSRALGHGGSVSRRLRIRLPDLDAAQLETMSDTKGRFILNAVLPIAFDGQGRMEIDLLCADARVAIELDGAQHLGDPIAYRRDRRKDQLLQENGYLVLRFLAEDVGKDLDFVLDAILRALSNRRSSPAGHAIPAASPGSRDRC